MRKERVSPSISYLIELVMAILFFAVACVICVNIFYQASIKSNWSEESASALIHAQSISEQAIGSQERMKSGTWNTDHNWQRKHKKSEYKISIQEHSIKKNVYGYELTMKKANNVLAKLNFTVLLKEESQ